MLLDLCVGLSDDDQGTKKHFLGSIKLALSGMNCTKRNERTKQIAVHWVVDTFLNSQSMRCKLFSFSQGFLVVKPNGQI